ncbi:MAG: transcriptional regulator [Burkholderiales bacterium PBB4]|nr:MAG: transcriptional regulator [Burkholderiales bacterium PBB4]
MKRIAVGIRSLAICVLVLVSPCAAWSLDTDAQWKQWLVRVHEASKQRTYAGTFVVSAGGNLASAKIWHVCEGTQQIERVEPLSGVPRASYRRNDQVTTLYPDSKVAIIETRGSLGSFPGLVKSANTNVGDHYIFSDLGAERMAGFDVDGVSLSPRDSSRYGYRVWSEKRTGLVLQVQTMDATGRVIEQSAFTEVQIDVPLKIAPLLQQMENLKGYKVTRPALRTVTPQAMGWSLKVPVAGFQQVGCYSRTVARIEAPASDNLPVMQWIFTDGLATLSLFVESFDPQRHLREGVTGTGGATQVVMRRVGDWWATAVGEVPASTLRAFVTALERKK